jgi:parvulin-like peptidyl-prolyl isomerase
MFLSVILALASLLPQFKSDVPAKYLVPAPKSTDVVAKVDGVEIRASEVEGLLWEWRAQEVAADLISYQVIKNAAVKEGVTATEAEVQKALDDQLAQFTPAVLQGKTLDQYLIENGFTRSRLWLRLRTEVLLNKIAAKDFKSDEYVKISTIVVRPVSTSTQALTDAAKKADLFYDMLTTKKESWEKVLNMSTTDPRTQESKGLVGWRRIDAFPALVQEEFKTLKSGGITKPTTTANGIQIFRIELLGKNAKAQDLSDAEAVHVGSNKATVANRIRSEAKIERFPQNSKAGGS